MIELNIGDRVGVLSYDYTDDLNRLQYGTVQAVGRSRAGTPNCVVLFDDGREWIVRTSQVVKITP